MNIYGIPKPAYRAYELLHKMGNELLKVKGEHDTVDVWVVRKQDKINIMITNWALPRHSIKTEQVKIKLEGMGEIKVACIERIDDTHANAHKAWVDMGKPESLTPTQVSALELASTLVMKPLTTKREKNSLLLELTVPPQGIAYITLE
jgi:xylan 1,4-beta-xylosidase